MSEDKQEKLDKARSMTIEEFEARIKPRIQDALDLINTHSDIPEDVNQAEVLSALISIGNEMTSTLTNRVPEIIDMERKIAKQENTIKQLQDTNQKLFIKMGEYRDPSKDPSIPSEPPQLSFDEIKKMWNL